MAIIVKNKPLLEEISDISVEIKQTSAPVTAIKKDGTKVKKYP